MYKTRTRFAPSPTGSLHIGGLRTALFNWLFAKANGGDFILRIEDTDQKRYDENALKVLLESLKWAGLEHDEFYVQSERLARYQEMAHALVELGQAYYCTCSEERLKQVNEQKIKEGRNPGYDAHCRPSEDGGRRLTRDQVEGKPYVIRLKMPRYGYAEFYDAVQSASHDGMRDKIIKFKNNVYNDIVLLKSDGFPTYHLAHVVDDHDMDISHVIRAVEWLPSTPTHLALWDAFGWQRPVYAHVPVMLNPGALKGKISKRKPPIDQYGNPIPVLVHDYIKEGYLPEAVLNWLANTAWNFGNDIEIFSMKQAIRRFRLSDINPSNTKLPFEKLAWINQQYIGMMGDVTFAETAWQHLLDDETLPLSALYADDKAEKWQLFRKVAPLIQPRVKTMKQAVELARPFFEAPIINDLTMFVQSPLSLNYVYSHVMMLDNDNWNVHAIRIMFELMADVNNLKLKDVCAPIRYALTGSTVSVPLFEMMEILGREEVLQRLEKVLQ